MRLIHEQQQQKTGNKQQSIEKIVSIELATIKRLNINRVLEFVIAIKPVHFLCCVNIHVQYIHNALENHSLFSLHPMKISYRTWR